VDEVIVRLNKLNEMKGGTPKHVAGGGGTNLTAGIGGAAAGGASAGIWKKLKGGKKKKHRHLTAPEITTQEVIEAAASQRKSQNSASIKELEGVKGDEDRDKKDGGKSKGIFGRKVSKEKSSPDAKDMKRKSRDVSGRNSEVVLRNDLAITPSDSEDAFLSQRSDRSLSQASASSPALKRASNANILDVLDLSQSSEKQHPLSSFALVSSLQVNLNDEPLSTQSSSDVGISSSLAATESEAPPTQEDNRGSSSCEEMGDYKTTGETGNIDEEKAELDEFNSYLQGCSALYKEFGSMEHKENVKKVQEFLESSNEMSPVDLRLLQDWEGWIVAVREIV